MNKSIMMGRLVRDPEIRYVDTQKGEMAIANFRLAVDRKFAKEDGEKADFFFCCAYGWLAEFTEKYLVQGLKIIVSGRMENDNYRNKDGEQVYGVRLIAEEINFAESKRTSEEHREERTSRKSSRKEASSARKSNAKSGRTSRREEDDYEEDYEDDYEVTSARQKSATGKSSGRRSSSSSRSSRERSRSLDERYMNVPDEELPFD
ncbi:single-stranded DNA-binding protein [Parablautia sp. Marseille-Q6255]|uniref:single-stranded DNA-binding protein n=1 Tax=Parablautia sp. Marseille-Q6255 TaxID=3039593 RepID=UPI0024BD5588|nr:single-stranded DNA-binding protein [Parablautia sp. Marseille-Q6255]